MIERRRFARYKFEWPVSVSTKTRKDRAGIGRDLSATGILFHSSSAFTIGEHVVLMFRTLNQLTSTTGQVVRSARVDELATVFAHATAVEFDVANLDLCAD